jgi:GAF domain-containing protein
MGDDLMLVFKLYAEGRVGQEFGYDAGEFDDPAFLRSSDGRVLRDYRLFEGKLNVINISVEGHSMQPVLKEGRVRRVTDSIKDGFIEVHKGSRSGLVVPLKYRGQVIGALIIESPQAEAFSQYDEHLMVVIASHLASLADYTRLREEAEGREARAMPGSPFPGPRADRLRPSRCACR